MMNIRTNLDLEEELIMVDSKYCNEKYKALFKSIIQRVNFITPYIIDVYGNRKYLVELSRTSDYNYQEPYPYYGVSVLDRNTKELNSELSKCFSKAQYIEAIDYINKIFSDDIHGK